MKSKPLLLIPALFLMLFMGCGDDPAGTANQPVSQVTSQSSGSQPAQAQPVKRMAVWPFIDEDQTDTELSGDLTARNFILIFDGSGSMKDSGCSGPDRKIDVAKQAVVAWSKSVPGDANLGLYSFNARGVIELPLSSGNRDVFMNRIKNIEVGGKTPLAKAIFQSYNALTKQGQRQLGYGEYTIVVVTDGIADDAVRLRNVVDMVLAKSAINIYSIGFCIRTRHSLNQPGRTYYRSADNPAQLRQGLQEVLAEAQAFDAQEFTKD